VAWLSAGDAAAQAVYKRVGFAVADTRLNYIEPDEGMEYARVSTFRMLCPSHHKASFG
jgi:hypothetical protein